MAKRRSVVRPCIARRATPGLDVMHEEPGGYFSCTAYTLERDGSAFYAPLISD